MENLVNQDNLFQTMLMILTEDQYNKRHRQTRLFGMNGETKLTGEYSFTEAVKNLPAVQGLQETWGQSLGEEDPSEMGMAVHSSILAWPILWTEKPGWLQSKGSQSDTTEAT